MAHRGEKTNGTHYRGFDRLRYKTVAAKSEEDERAEQVLRDFQAGKYGPPVEEEEKPKPTPKPEEEPKPAPTTEPAETDLDRIRKRIKMERELGLKRGAP